MRIVFRAGNTFAVFLFLAKTAFAVDIIPCPSAGSGIPIGDLSLGSGCAEVDKSFSNFVDSLVVGSLGGGAEFSFSASGMAPQGDIMSPVTAEFGILGVQQLTPAYQESITYNVVSNTSGSYNGGSYPTPATPGATWAISGLTFTPSISVNGNGQNASASEAFCLNAASVIDCPSLDSGEISVVFSKAGASITCLGVYCASANGSVVNFPTPVTQIALDFDVDVNGPTTEGVTLHTFDTVFDGVAVPESAAAEPSTFLMVVIGVACLVVPRRGRWTNRLNRY